MSAPMEIGTVGVMVAVIFGLIEIVKMLIKPLAAKFMKNGEAAQQRAVFDALKAQTRSLEEQTRSLEEQNKRLASIDDALYEVKEESSEMYRWHKPESEPGVKVWWVRLGPVQKAIESLAEAQGETDATISRMLHAIERIAEDTKITKEDVVKLVLHMRFKDHKSSPLDTSGR